MPCKGHGPGLWTQSWVQCRPGPCCCIVEANGYLPQASSSHLIHQGKAVSLRQSWRINYDDTPNYLKTPQHMVGIKYMVSSPHASFHPLKLCSQAGSTKPLTASTASQQSISDPFLNTERQSLLLKEQWLSTGQKLVALPGTNVVLLFSLVITRLWYRTQIAFCIIFFFCLSIKKGNTSSHYRNYSCNMKVYIVKMAYPYCMHFF